MFNSSNTPINYGSQPYNDLYLLAENYCKLTPNKPTIKNTLDNPFVSFPMTENPNLNLLTPGFENPLKAGITKSQVNLMNMFRMLWEQHSIWTRSAIYSIVESSPFKDLVINRLLRNPQDFGEVLKLYYGDKNAATFSQLLKGHLVIAADLVKASKAGDTKSAAEIERKWYANADDIAYFLASINPNWLKDEWKNMLHKHLSLVKAEAVDAITKDYAAGIIIYDDIEKQALEMADVMAEGIIKQFPNKFL